MSQTNLASVPNKDQDQKTPEPSRKVPPSGQLLYQTLLAQLPVTIEERIPSIQHQSIPMEANALDSCKQPHTWFIPAHCICWMGVLTVKQYPCAADSTTHLADPANTGARFHNILQRSPQEHSQLKTYTLLQRLIVPKVRLLKTCPPRFSKTAAGAPPLPWVLQYPRHGSAGMWKLHLVLHVVAKLQVLVF